MNHRDLYVTIEKSPEMKKVYGTMGKLKNFLEKEVETTLKDYIVKIFWGREMLAFLEDSTGTPQEIAHVTEIGVTWDAEGLKLLKCANPKIADMKMLSSSRRFR